MPVIKTFDAGQLGLQPTEIGVESQAAAGRRLGMFYNQVGQAQERFGERTGQQMGSAIRDVGEAIVTGETHREVSQGAATFASLADDLTNKWNEIAKNADPNDASVAAKFRDTVLEPALEKFNGAFHTEAAQNWAEHHVEQLRQHMFEKTAADMATRAGQAARENVQQTINTLSNTAYREGTEPKFALNTVDSTVGGIVASSPNLKGAAAGALRTEISEKAREQIVKAAAIGAIEKTGQVPSWVTDPKYSKYVNGIELKQFQKAADAQTKANLYYEKQLETLKKQQADLNVHKGAGDLMSSVTVDPNNPGHILIPPDFMQKAIDLARKNPDAPSAAGTVRTMIDWAESQQRARAEPLTTDAPTKAALLTGMFNPDKPTTEIDVLRAAADGKLSAHDTTLLREMVKATGPDAMHEPLVHAALAGAAERVGQHLMIDGNERYANFLQAFWPEYLKQKREGKDMTNALDLKDENSLIRKALKQYEPDMKDRMSAHIAKKFGVSVDQMLGASPAGNPVKTETVTKPIALPPKDKLEDGKTYETARGPLKWDAKRGVFVTP